MRGMVLDAKWEPKADYQVSEWEKTTRKAITGNSIWRHPKLEVRDWPDPEPGPERGRAGNPGMRGLWIRHALL